MIQVRFPSWVWFALSLICVYLLWDVIRSSFNEPELARPVRVLDQFVSNTPFEPAALASAETVEPNQAVEAPSDASTPPPLPVECRDEIITLTSKSDEAKKLCVESRDVIQNGASRNYRFRTSGAGKFELRVRANGTAIEAVELDGAKSGPVSCEAEQCSGIVIGKRDATGRRNIKIDMFFSIANPKDDAAGDSIGIQANLKTKPDHEVAALTCVGQGVTLIGSDNSSINFCPLGGNGFSATEDGSSTTYQFRNLENEMITVTVDESQAIKKIGFDEDRLFCANENCIGASISVPNEKGERIFSFSGTMLQGIGGANETVILNGTLILQAIS